jgi:transposase
MSLRPQPLPPVPDETARIAHAAFPKAHPYLALADELDALFSDDQFTPLYPLLGQPALAPWRLALVTILQFAENLSDRKAADAVRARLDWKYLLRLEVGDAGFDASVLVEFRGRLLSGRAEQQLFETLLAWCRERRLLNARGTQRTDSTHVLAAVRALTRFEVVGEAMRHALNALAVAAPAWLAERADPSWVERYADREMDDHLPASRPARLERAVRVGRDGRALLGAIWAEDAPPWLRQLPAVETLRRIWVQNYHVTDGEVAWRADDAIPPAARFIGSPYDLDAAYARKRTTSWLGYKVHVTETCDPGHPRLITDVQTTAAPVVDEDSLPPIQHALADRDLLPAVQLADSGYTAAGLLVDSRRRHGIALIGAARPDVKWQAQEGMGFALADFQVDWEAGHAVCPMGCISSSWTPVVEGRQQHLIKVKFARGDCVPCPCRPRCTRAKDGRRTLTLRPPEQARALAEARARAKTAAFAATYAQREGVEGTLSLGIRACGLRRARYIGLARTRLQHLLTATAINFLRLGHWLIGSPPARTRRTAFVRLMQEVAAA